MNAGQESSEQNDLVMQHAQAMGIGESAPLPSNRPLAPPDATVNNSGNTNPGTNALQLQSQPPPSTNLSMTFPGLGNPGDHQVPPPPPPPVPPPRCQIVNPFLGSPPLVQPERLPLQPVPMVGGSSIGGQLQIDNVNPYGNQDMRYRGYLGIVNLPPPFQVQIPNLQSQIQAFQQDVLPQLPPPHALMAPQQQQHQPQQQQHQPPQLLQQIQQQAPPGFLQGLMASEIVPASNDSRGSQLLQPHMRQRARRRSRANRAASIQPHAQETVSSDASMGENNGASGGPPGAPGHGVGAGGLDVASGGNGGVVPVILRPREMPTAPLTVDSGFGDMDGDSIGPASGGRDDAKCNMLEDNYTSIGENFECNICFQKANEAVVTCCGHLFCWPCLYRWLHIHSYHKECPVCKGAIDESNITPIYGRECSTLLSARGLPGGSAAERIPPRPPARRVESARQLREREDRSREREQRERAMEREREREREQQQQQQAETQASQQQPQGEVFIGPGVNPALIVGMTTASVDPMLPAQRESTTSTTPRLESLQTHRVGREGGDAGGGNMGGSGGGAGGDTTITSSSRSQQQQEELDSMASVGHENGSDQIEPASRPQTIGPPGVSNVASFASERRGGRGRFTPPSALLPELSPREYSHLVGAGGRVIPPHQLEGLGHGTGTNTTTSGSTSGDPTFLQSQRRVSDRREQLRVALAASAQIGSGGAMNLISSSGERMDERRKMMAAAALLSQEWEDIVNISQLVGPVNPSQAAAWMAAVQGRLASTEGPSVDALGNTAASMTPFQSQQQREGQGGHSLHQYSALPSVGPVSSMPSPQHMISQVSHGGSGGVRGAADDSSLGNLIAVNPIRAGSWLENMRSRLTSMEKIVQNGGSNALQLLQQHPQHHHHGGTGGVATATAAVAHMTQNLHLPSAQSSTLSSERLEGCHLQQPIPRARANSLVELDLLNSSDQQHCHYQPISMSNSSTISTNNMRIENCPSNARGRTLLENNFSAERKQASVAGGDPTQAPRLPGAAATAPASSSTSTSTSSTPSSSHPAGTTKTEPRLLYCEAPPMHQRPPHCSSSCRRRSTSRLATTRGGGELGEESSASIDSNLQEGRHTGSSAVGSRRRHGDAIVEGSGCSTTGNTEPMAAKSKRRRVD